MNRIKVWAFTLLVVIAGAAVLVQHTRGLRADAIASLDAVLASAAGQVGSSLRGIAHEAVAVASLAARDARLAPLIGAKQRAPAKERPAAKARPAGKRAAGKARREAEAQAPAPAVPPAMQLPPGDAAHAALSTAEDAAGFRLSGAVAAAANRESLAGSGPPGVSGEGKDFLGAAVEGNARRGFVRMSRKLWYAAAAPIGPGAGLVVLVPLDEAWAKGLASSAGVDVTVSAPDVERVSTSAGPVDAAGAGLPPGKAADVGVFGKAKVTVGPLKLPALPLALGKAPAARARALALEGVENGSVIVSVPAGKALAAIVRTDWIGLAALAVTLALGIVLGFTVRAADAPMALPEELVAAAVRIENGDFAARAPELAGKLGTVAAALNRAAELAGPAAAAAGVPPHPAEEPEGSPLEEGNGPAAGGLFDAAPEGEPDPGGAEPESGEPEADPGAGRDEALAENASAPDLLQAAAAIAPAEDEDEDEAHWREVFDDFLRTRADCGEPSEGLTYDKFRTKLEGNRTQLVARYSCRTVRFQVYVKDGKAALKATPVR